LFAGELGQVNPVLLPMLVSLTPNAQPLFKYRKSH
jgi:hypothetical protein